jgi:hypothetical protein
MKISNLFSSIFCSLIVLVFLGCSPTGPELTDWRKEWNSMVGTGVWWGHSHRSGNSMSSIEFYRDSIVGYDYKFSPRKQKAIIFGKLIEIDSLDVTAVHKFKWYIVGRKNMYHESNDCKLLTTQVKVKQIWASDVYDHAVYYYWAISQLIPNAKGDIDSLYMGYVDDDTNEYMYTGYVSKPPLELDFSNISPF